MRKKYTYNVHYDYVMTVEFFADENDDLKEIAENLAEEKMENGENPEYVDLTDSCEVNCEELTDEDYDVICWPESQDLFELSGFRENCRLVNGIRGIEKFGSSAYLVPILWLGNAIQGDDCADAPLEMVDDKELEDLHLL